MKILRKQNWKQIWLKKGRDVLPLASDRITIIKKLLEINGWDSKSLPVTAESWLTFIERMRIMLAIGPTDSVFEVGCGAGLLLYSLQNNVGELGGLDYSASLVALAHQLLPAANFLIAEANRLPIDPKYDFVLSNGVFLYFPNQGYTEKVIGRMVEKARKGVGIFHLNNADYKDQIMQMRMDAYAPQEYKERYAGLEQLFFKQSWFQEIANDANCSCIIEDDPMPEYEISRSRFNVYMKRRA